MVKKKEHSPAPLMIGTSLGMTSIGVGAGVLIGNPLLGLSLGMGLSAVLSSMFYHDKDFHNSIKKHINKQLKR